MISILWLVVCLGGGQGEPKAQPVQPPAIIQELADIEGAFARQAARSGISPAFVEFLADDGLLFRPLPVLGKKVHQAKPAPSEQRLSWKPEFVVAAGSRSLGFTTGPFEFRANAEAAPSHGHYVTIWKKTPAGWRAAIDLGISHPPMPAPRALTWLEVPQVVRARLSQDQLKQELTQLETKFHASASTERQAYARLAHPQMRWYRPGQAPLIGAAQIKDWSTSRQPPSWRPTEVVVDSTGDFAYTHGVGESVASSQPSRFSYVHIYRGGEQWSLLLDIALLIPGN